MKYIVLPFITLTMLVSAAPSYSHVGDLRGEEVSVEVVSDGGGRFHTIPHKDFRRGGTRVLKKYLEARRGENYSIVIRNNTPGRIGVVIAVDGRNIISGKESHLKNGEPMYIVNGRRHAKYEGWRTDDTTVHGFYFTDPDDSYAVKTFKDSSAMGVIAVAVFKEKERRIPFYKEGKRRNAPAGPSMEAAPRSKSGKLGDAAGTGFGEGKHSPAVKVFFEPEDVPAQKTLIKYEWREVLCGKALLACGPKTGNRLWDEDEYAPYPPGYVTP